MIFSNTKLIAHCTVSDISVTGARIVIEPDVTIPDEFLLSLAATGRVLRNCRVVWRKDNIAGVQFGVDQ